MKIDRKLNLVIPIDQGSTTIYVHASPISREVFQKYYKVISRAFTQIWGGGHGMLAGPRIAALLLRDEAQSMGILDGPEGVELGLFGEIKRLANVLAPADGGGWGTIPITEAVERAFIDADDWAEVENALAFFTVASRMLRRGEAETMLTGGMEIWGAQITSSNCTEFRMSLPTSTQDVSTGVKETLSSIPS